VRAPHSTRFQHTTRILGSDMFRIGISLPVRGSQAASFRRSIRGLLTIVGLTVLGGSTGYSATGSEDRDSNPAEWPYLGGNAESQQYGAVSQIDSSAVAKLGLLRYVNLPIKEGLVGNALIKEGIAYESGPRGAAVAVEIATGRLLWNFEPTLDYANNSMWSMWTSHNSRGLALDSDKVYTANGCSLFAVDRKSGSQVWKTQVCDPTRDLGTSSAPRIGGGKVFVGIGNAERGFDRSYAAAYDAKTGQELWRFYTTPGDPSRPFENVQMAIAAKSWGADYSSQNHGGSGAAGVWEGMIYDPKTDLLIFGTGNPAALDPEWLAAREALYSDSIIAVNATTGRYAWHYQTLPGDAWGFSDAASHMVLADLPFPGGNRRVLISAEKQLLYVLDAKTGAFISADAYVPNTNFSAIDPKTGKLQVRESLKFWKHPDKSVFALPGSEGGHAWTLSAYNPQTGLFYIPAFILPAERFGSSASEAPSEQKVEAKSRLIAWDPVGRKERWHVDGHPAMNGGVLTTSGGLVFQGTAGGKFNAYDARTGKPLWSFDTHSIIEAGPSTVTINNQQVIVVAGGDASANGTVRFAVENATTPETLMAPSRLLIFGLGGKETIPASPLKILAKPASERPPAALASEGAKVFSRNRCDLCHGSEMHVSGLGRIPDLRTISLSQLNAMPLILQQGILMPLGMPRFANLTDVEVKALQAFIQMRAWKDYDQQQAAGRAN
jgi:PQQ-dependent dehydrogenase (methanol/ethanol family)